MDTSFCIKEAPDVDTPFSVQNGRFALYADRLTLNAYDASAAEAVLRLIEEMRATLRRGGEARRRDRDDPRVARGR